eukprot:6180951-Pleurochrysis_carterae.AAC.1
MEAELPCSHTRSHILLVHALRGAHFRLRHRRVVCASRSAPWLLTALPCVLLTCDSAAARCRSHSAHEYARAQELSPATHDSAV